MPPNKQPNPFRYGSPVPPDSFFGRENALHTLFSRLNHGESAVVVGGPHKGKSSLLKYMAHADVLTEWFAGATMQVIPVERDCHMLSSDYQPAHFWRDVLAEIAEQPLGRKIKTQIARAEQSNYGSYTLERFFTLLGQSSKQVVLLIDEFEVLLNHPCLNTPEFFGALRALAIKTDGLALIAASRLPIAELNRRTNQVTGSPFFNFCTDIVLQPLAQADIDRLLDAAEQRSSITFTAEDRHFIQRMSGRHPFLVQVSAAALFEAMRRGGSGNKCYTEASMLIQDWAGSHFDESWHYLNTQSQQVLRLLALTETRSGGGHLPPETEQFDSSQHRYELTKLEKEHVIEPSSDAEGFLWRGQRWHVSAVSFAIWIAQNICELPDVRLEEADKVPDAPHGQVLPTHIIVYGDYVGGSKQAGDITVSDVSGGSVSAGHGGKG